MHCCLGGNPKTSTRKLEQIQFGYVARRSFHVPYVTCTHTSLQPLSYVKQEHILFSAYFEAFLSGHTDAMTSSLVFSDDFIHSYVFTFWRPDWPMIAYTYPRRGKSCFPAYWSGAASVVDAMKNHLEVSHTGFSFDNTESGV